MGARQSDTPYAQRNYTHSHNSGNSRNHYGDVNGDIINNYSRCQHLISSVDLDADGDSDTPIQRDQTYLGAAIMRCDHRAVTRLLKEGSGDVNCNGTKDKTCLRLAIEAGHTLIFRDIIDAGALVETTSGDLRAAASLGNCEIIRTLLQQPTYMERWEPDCNDALLDACRSGRVDVAQLFLDKAKSFQESPHIADPKYLSTETDFNGIYADAFRIASGEGHDQLVQIMLHRGIEVDIRRGLKKTALQKASAKGHLETVQILLDAGADVNLVTGRPDRDALYLASSEGRADVVVKLLANGANVSARVGFWGNALQAAASNGHNRVVQLLLLRGHADVNAQGGYEANALQAAASNGHHEIVHTLLSHRARVNASGGHYGNALQVASVNGHTEVVNELLARGANVNAKGGRFGTALQAAAAHGHLAIVRKLIEEGADKKIAGGEHGNALAAAYQSRCKETIRALGGEDLEGIAEALVPAPLPSSALLTGTRCNM